ncbi:MAG: glycosyltransferase [Candidatus Omnitrophota bacterium]|jgi:glycosyltransferase involved in cell wall biosynthesis|nr:MAG: glycosyltransferase [Candidatus Omnitrophota bacterium]
MRNIDGLVSIVMPTYNEAENIFASINETIKTFDNFGCKWELVILDDGSTDNTYDILKSIEEKHNGRVIVRKNPFNVGKGRALKKAFHYVNGDYVVFIDADMDLHPLQVQTLFDIMKLDNADIVIGSKLHPNSLVNYPFYRRIISYIYYLIIKLLFNLPCHDTQTGLKLFKTQVLKAVFPRILVKKFAFDLEVLANANHLGYKIAEAPIVLDSKRPFGRIGLKAMITTFWDTLAIFYRMHIIKYYDRIDYYRRKNMAKEFKRMRR